MEKTRDGERSTAQPTSPSINSTLLLRSDIPLDGVDLSAAANLVREHGHQSPVSSSPSKTSGPPSAEKVHGLRADMKVPVDFDPPVPQKLFARPSSASQPLVEGGFSFGKVDRRSGVKALPPVQKHHEKDRALPEREESKPVQMETNSRISTFTAFDMGNFNIIPPSMVREVQTRAKKSSQASDNASPIKSNSGNKSNVKGDRTPSGVLQSPAASSCASSGDAQLALTSIEGRISAKMTPSERASGSPQAECSVGSRHENRPTPDDALRLRNSVVREKAQMPSDDTSKSIEKPQASNSDKALPNEPGHHIRHVTNTLSKAFNDTRMTSNGRRSIGPIADNSQTPKTAISSMGNCPEEDIFILLLNRSRQQKRNSIRTTARQKQMATTISQLCHANERYQSQLNEAHELHSQHVATIEEQERASEDMKTKFGTLKNFVKGLTNDMESVRKESDIIGKSQSEAEKLRGSLMEETRQLRTVNDNSIHRMTQMRDTMAELHGKIESAGAVNKQLQIAIKVEEGRLQEEKEKTSWLQQEMESRRSITDEQLELLRSQQIVLLDQIGGLPNLIEKLLGRWTDTSSSPSELQKCLETAKSICATERITPADIKDLETSMVTGLTESIKTCLEEPETIARTFHDTNKAFCEKVQAEVEDLRNGFEKMSDSQHRIAVLQEANIRLEERLTAKNEALDDFGVKFDALCQREKSLLESIPQMKDELTSMRENGASNPSSPGKGSVLEHWKSLVEEYRVKWMSANSEKAKLSEEMTDINDKLQEQVALAEDKQRAFECLRDEHAQVKNDLQCSEAKLRNFDPQELDRLKSLVVEQESRIDRTMSDLQETTSCLLDNRQTIEHLQIEGTTLQNKLQDLQYQHDASLNRAGILEASNARFQQDLKDIDTLRTQANQVPQLTSELSQEKRANSEQTIVIEQLRQEQQRLQVLKTELVDKLSENTQLAKQIEDQHKLEQHIVHLAEELELSRSSNEAMRRRSEEVRRRLFNTELQNRPGEEASPETYPLGNIFSPLNSSNIDLKRKNERIKQLDNTVEEQAKIINQQRSLISKLERRSDGDFGKLLAEQMPSIYSPETNGNGNGNAFITPDQAIKNGDNITTMPKAPCPERRRSLEDVEKIRMRMAADTDHISETQIGQENETPNAEPSSDLTSKPESSPCKPHRASLSGAAHFRRSMNENIDDSQLTVVPPTPKPLQRSESGISQTTEEASEMSHPSTQGDEMLLERQSQMDGFADSTDVDTQDERELSEVASESENDSPVKRKSAKATTKSTAGKATKTPLNGVKRMSTRSSEKVMSVDKDQDAQPGKPSENGGNAMSAPNTVRRKHQPNSGLKRQFDSDIGTQSPERSPKKALKRNNSAAGTRKSGSVSVSFFDQMPDATNGTLKTPQTSTALPPGSKKGSIGGRQSNGEGKSQKRNKKPRKGSKGDQYDNRFGQILL
ncbi:MAG: hypothetical protein Q9160_007610 [Pyrenula sp. 1 TL-2023]